MFVSERDNAKCALRTEGRQNTADIQGGSKVLSKYHNALWSIIKEIVSHERYQNTYHLKDAIYYVVLKNELR